MNKKKNFAALLISAAMVLGMAGIANAATYDDPITSIDISIEYELSSSMTASDIDVSSGTDGGAWLRDSVGWWYCNADRSYTKNDWQQIGGLWYYFDENGYMKTGWFQSPAFGYWYYLDSNDGHMVTDQYIGSYYVNGEGVWVS